jgi:DNA-binding beta-propeller fold protein YncE/predicted GH43/DUF377 family glycosyl hydrolase
MHSVLATLLVATGCVRVSELPDVGECASYPEAPYEYGQIGIGECISGPNQIRFAGEDGAETLLITNSNPYRVFDGGNLLAIPWNNIDFGDQDNEVHTLDPVALSLPSFALGLEVNDSLGMIALRESADARTRDAKDDVLLLDLSDPTNPARSDRGTDGGDTVKVVSDPVDIAHDSETGLTFVANQTAHTISVLDTTGETIELIQPWPESMVTAAAYFDHSETDGRARVVDFDILGDGALIDDSWTMTWVEGTWRLWVPSDLGLHRWTTQLERDESGAPVYESSAMGAELALEDAPDDVLEFSDPDFSGASDIMFFASEGNLWMASSGSYLGDWAIGSAPAILSDADSSFAWLGGPNLTPGIEATHIFFDAQASDIGADGPSFIGTATSLDGLSWSVEDTPLIEPTHPHEGDHIADPDVIYDAETQTWRMVYSAFDGTQWTIGHATSEDLQTWTSDDEPLFRNLLGAAAPVLHSSVGSWHLWYSNWTGEAWEIGYAESPDGTHWDEQPNTLNFGEGTVIDDEARPPSVALQGSAQDTFQVRGESTGFLPAPLLPGLSYAALTYGWTAEVLAGAWLDLGDAGPHSNGSIQVDDLSTDADGNQTAWLTLTSRSGRTRIGQAAVNEDDTLTATHAAVFEGGSSNFEKGGVSHPTIFENGDQLHMLYAGTKNGKQSIGLATFTDGEWISEGKVFSPNSSRWDGVSVVPNTVVPLDEGGWRLWYSGFDGGTWRIGSATSNEDGTSWSRDAAPRGYQLGTGQPGVWDDTGVRDAWVIHDDSGDHIWYAGFDGNTWQIGYGFRPQGEPAFERSIDSFTEEGRPALIASGGLFHRTGVFRPVVSQTPDGFSILYAGQSGQSTRVGRAFGRAEDRLNRTPRRPRVGDTLVFDTDRGDGDAWAIPLDGTVAGHPTTGEGLTDLHVDEERGLLFAVSQTTATIFVIDIRDDTDLSSGFYDRNYLDMEAILLLNTGVYATGYRQILTVPGSDTMYALVDAPESVITIDLSTLVDDEYAEASYDIATGYLAAPRGRERDEGTASMTNVGPGQMILHEDGKRLFVSNFNRNSVSVYDLSLGPYGMQIREIRNVGENPYAMAFSPDGNKLVVGNYTGEVIEKVSHGSLGIIDVDSNSPTYLEVVSWIVNR